MERGPSDDEGINEQQIAIESVEVSADTGTSTELLRQPDVDLHSPSTECAAETEQRRK